MEADAMQALAGPAAEARYRRYSAACILMTGGADDWKAAEKLARDFIERESELGQVVDSLYKRATRLVCQPGHWKAVLAVGDALLERWTLTAKEAVALMEDAAG